VTVEIFSLQADAAYDHGDCTLSAQQSVSAQRDGRVTALCAHTSTHPLTLSSVERSFIDNQEVIEGR